MTKKITSSSNLTNDEKQELIKDIKTFVRTTYGKKAEKETIKEYNNDKNCINKIKYNNSKLFKKKIYQNREHELYIVGKIDGIVGEKIIEIKNRTKPTFINFDVSQYDIIQTQAYLRIYDEKNINSIILFERYSRGGKNMTRQSEYKKEDYDTLWNEIVLPKLKMFLFVFIKGCGDGKFLLSFFKETNPSTKEKIFINFKESLLKK